MKFLVLLAVLQITTIAAPVQKLGNFSLADQDDRTRVFKFPRGKVTVMTVADHKGSSQLAPWIQRVFNRFQKSIIIDGVADVSMIPKPFQSMFRGAFKKQLTYSVLLDWDGNVVKQFDYKKGVANVYVIDCNGNIVIMFSGPVTDKAFAELEDAVNRAMNDAPAL